MEAAENQHALETIVIRLYIVAHVGPMADYRYVEQVERSAVARVPLTEYGKLFRHCRLQHFLARHAVQNSVTRHGPCGVYDQDEI